ncbi:hypothetical protein M5X00_19815 [Paenibacillus alvei]|nr:hypothetical protein [Paenibacillus alvei]MCY9540017.1 hypothetical protein [Paenibacillus alvei]MCY9705511.1 hypothetical protein [Paenibacillus alvei]MCY9735750.1 hypothetical protein [Paenibacillus alvei]MCY9756491.1 hypothetical protein [Paenibacillus alvei]MEC0084559.1 hypothetical protein [Paenibacillus alvei]
MRKVEVITGQLVVEDGIVSIQREDGSMIKLSKSDRIEVFNDGKFEPAPYLQILEKVDSAGWPLYAGLYASVELMKSKSNQNKKETPVTTEVSKVCPMGCDFKPIEANDCFCGKCGSKLDFPMNAHRIEKGI